MGVARARERAAAVGGALDDVGELPGVTDDCSRIVERYPARGQQGPLD
jgi:hypothetical protein